ncbi:MutH/Sau3AI family endonuclease [uncultured Desulfovibrio sp.]|uniref:MutH/Sau3AI family endonuclease n=1 Tax=uncultured Desulfovibrio sp. TaxID=167968 RepID=UPI002804F88F|nr:MutH/Sau3AI family endonuclease [uncultured Desulfovibrio sp.]
MDSEYTVYTRQEIITLLESILGKTLGEIDSAHIFDKRTQDAPKITGIAGAVIETSVFGYPPNSSREADLLIDGIPVELKTIGVRPPKDDPDTFEAKEPLTITSVSLPKDGSEPHIIHEVFQDSHFWKKAEHLLIVIYHYAAASPVPSRMYASFRIEGYIFNEFNEEDRLRLETDWNIIKDHIAHIYAHSADPTRDYPRLSSELRPRLVYLAIAPRFPNAPRFRLKRSLVSKIVQDHFPSAAALPQYLPGYTSFADFDRKCAEIERNFAGKSLDEMLAEFGMTRTTRKNIAEQAVVRMFGGERDKLNELEVFNSFGLIAKNVTLTREGKRTEDTKLFTLDFHEWDDPSLTFDESSAYSYFSEHQFFFIIFEEPSHDAPLGENIFKGFRRYTFSNEFIYTEVKKTWERIGTLIREHALKETPILDKQGRQIFNPTGEPQTSINFPKASESIIFVRGTSSDSRNKPVEVNGIRMYRQQLWIKGSWIAEHVLHMS